MRVILVNKFHYLRGGAERAYFDMAKILEDNGHEVAYFSTHHPNNRDTRWNKYFVKAYDYNVKLKVRHKVSATAKIFYNREAKRKLLKLLNDFKPDIVHFHNIYHQLSPSVISAVRKKRIPMVMTLHDFKLVSPNYNLSLNGEIWEKSKPKKYWMAVKDRCTKNSYFKSLVCTFEAYLFDVLKVYGKIDGFVSPSNFLREKFIDYGFKREIVVIPNPVLGDFMSASAGMEGAGNYLLYFGRLSKEKGLDILLKAFAKLCGEWGFRDLQLYIAGDGIMKKELGDLAQDLGVAGKVYFLGHLNSKELKGYIKNAKLILHPSACHDNYPYSVLEALAAGKVVLANNVGGIPEIIKDGHNGYLIEKMDVEALAEKIKEASALSSDERTAISNNAKKFIEENNDSRLYYEKLLKLYQDVILKK